MQTSENSEMGRILGAALEGGDMAAKIKARAGENDGEIKENEVKTKPKEKEKTI